MRIFLCALTFLAMLDCAFCDESRFPPLIAQVAQSKITDDHQYVSILNSLSDASRHDAAAGLPSTPLSPEQTDFIFTLISRADHNQNPSLSAALTKFLYLQSTIGTANPVLP